MYLDDFSDGIVAWRGHVWGMTESSHQSRASRLSCRHVILLLVLTLEHGNTPASSTTR